MAWAASPTNPKYRSAEHRRERARLAKLIDSGHALDCTAKVCLFDRSPIIDSNGNHDAGLHLGHEDDGINYRGPEHRMCNLHDAAKRANLRSRGVKQTVTRWIL